MSVASPPSLSTGLWSHLASVAVLLPATYCVWDLIGQPHPVPFWLAIAIPLVHQFFVWICWRQRLNSLPTLSFSMYLPIFIVLLIARPISLLFLAFVDRDSLEITMSLRILITMALALPAAYAMYSVFRYFGVRRAAGADHYFAEYRNLPMESRGLFKYTNNGMYLYGFLGIWAIAFGFASLAAIVVCAFAHIYIWVHFLFVERPDMNYLYSQRPDPSSGEILP